MIADGTQVRFTIQEDETVREEIASTVDGVASFSLSSAFDGLLVVDVAVVGEDLSSEVAVKSTSNFVSVIESAAQGNAVFENGKILQGGEVALFLRNLSNRTFNIDRIDVTQGFGVDETTALKVEKSTGKMSVIGKEGVVILAHTAKNTFRYHFMPNGEAFNLSDLTQPKRNHENTCVGSSNPRSNA